VGIVPWTHERRSIGDSLARLVAEVGGLVADTMRLLGAEARGRLSELMPALAFLAAATATLLLAATAMGAAAVAALVGVMPLWAAALVVAAGALSLATLFGTLASRRLRGIARPPEHTLHALEKGTEWLRLRSTDRPTTP
jgi:hypothetical protein